MLVVSRWSLVARRSLFAVGKTVRIMNKPRTTNDWRRTTTGDNLMNITLGSTFIPPPDAKLPDAKAAVKNEKAARDFEAMLLTPVLDSLDVYKRQLFDTEFNRIATSDLGKV